jgi:hypothetical protein
MSKWTNNKLIAEVNDTFVKDRLQRLPRVYKRGSQKGKILFKLLLSHSKSNGKVLTMEFNRICFRYPSRINEMRADGWKIQTIKKGFQEYYYELDPDQAFELNGVMTDFDFQDVYLKSEGGL